MSRVIELVLLLVPVAEFYGDWRCDDRVRWFLRGVQEARAMVIDNESDQVREGHLVDALALRGDEGRGTLR
jgi:hypothetical protein